MRTTTVALLSMAVFASLASADDFTLKNAAGETFGPFTITRGATLRLGDVTYTVTAVTNATRQLLQRKLDSIIIPELSFTNTPIQEAIDFIRAAARKNDPTREGVNIAFTSSPWGFSTNTPPADDPDVVASFTLDARQIPLREALRVTCALSGFRCILRDSAVLIQPRNAPVGPFCRRICHIPQGPMAVVGLGEAKEFLAGFGMSWPTGSSIQYTPRTGRMVVVNTEENLATLDRILPLLDGTLRQIKMEFFFTAFPTGMVARAPSGRPFTSGDALKLWKEGQGRAVSTLLVTTRSASEATSKDTTEFIYPTEFSFEPSGQESNPPPSSVGGAFTPGGFETREVGAIVSVMPEVMPDGQTIDLTFTPQFVEEPVWEEYKTVVVSAGSSPTNVTCRQPIFSEHTISTQLSVRNGSTIVVGGGWNLRRTPEVMYLIIKTDLIDRDGKVLPSPDLNEIIPDPL